MEETKEKTETLKTQENAVNIDEKNSTQNVENLVTEQKQQKKQKKDKKREKKTKDFTPLDLENLKEKLDRKESGFFEKLTTKRFVKKATRDIIVRRLIVISMVSILLIIGVLYVLSYTYTTAAGYGINIIADNSNTKSISLCDDSSFNNLSVGLKATGIDALDNITFDWLPRNIDESTGGTSNGDNYIAYTFYVINTGNEDLIYSSNLYIISSTLEVETAVRVLIYKNSIPIIYTHDYETQIDGLIENYRGVNVETFTEPNIINYNESILEKEKYDKFTIVIWLEGEDVDCVDNKHSGALEIAWKFNVIENQD